MVSFRSRCSGMSKRKVPHHSPQWRNGSIPPHGNKSSRVAWPATTSTRPICVGFKIPMMNGPGLCCFEASERIMWGARRRRPQSGRRWAISQKIQGRSVTECCEDSNKEWEHHKIWTDLKKQNESGTGKRCWIECRWNQVEIQRISGGSTVIREIAHTSVANFLFSMGISIWSILKCSNYNSLDTKPTISTRDGLWRAPAGPRGPATWTDTEGFFFLERASPTSTWIRPLIQIYQFISFGLVFCSWSSDIAWDKYPDILLCKKK